MVNESALVVFILIIFGYSATFMKILVLHMAKSVCLDIFHLVFVANINPLTLGAVEYKLFVGSLNKQATEMEVQEVGWSSAILLSFNRWAFLPYSLRALLFHFDMSSEVSTFLSFPFCLNFHTADIFAIWTSRRCISHAWWYEAKPWYVLYLDLSGREKSYGFWDRFSLRLF